MKKTIVYIFIMLIVLWCGASFSAQDLTQYSAYTNLQSKSMKAAALKDFRTLMQSKYKNPEINKSNKQETEMIFKLNDNDEEILHLKYKLYYLNYIANEPKNNVLDDLTSEALRKYQINNHLYVSGLIDKATADSISNEQITFVQGKTGKEIKDFQLILLYIGYLDVYPSGYYGSVTAQAVKLYQKDNNITISGNMDIRTQQLLKNEEYIFKLGQKSSAILEMQKILVSQGYLANVSDGTFDDNTKKAIESFQKANDLQVNGELDKITIDKLNSVKQTETVEAND